jgi:regulator of protease activity HflC (stomatin/prohibitin superfamily)
MISGKGIIKSSAAAVILAIGGIYGLAGITGIEPGEVGVIVKNIGANRGMQEETLNTGMHWLDPFIYDVPIYNVKLRQYQLNDVPASTKDGQPIEVDVSFEIGLVDSGVPNLHETIGKDYFNQVVYPAARATIRTATANKLSDEVYTGEGRAAIQTEISNGLQIKLESAGIRITANLRNIDFLNTDFVATLEEKAKAAQKEVIQERLAAAAIQEALKVKAVAEGQKFRVIQEAEAEREKLRLQGEGVRLQKEEEAKGILAVGLAEAEVTKQKRAALAGAGGAEMVSIAWAENLGPNVKVYGVPTGAPGTNSIIDINGILQGAFKQ